MAHAGIWGLLARYRPVYVLEYRLGALHAERAGDGLGELLEGVGVESALRLLDGQRPADRLDVRRNRRLVRVPLLVGRSSDRGHPPAHRLRYGLLQPVGHGLYDRAVIVHGRGALDDVAANAPARNVVGRHRRAAVGRLVGMGVQIGLALLADLLPLRPVPRRDGVVESPAGCLLDLNLGPELEPVRGSRRPLVLVYARDAPAFSGDAHGHGGVDHLLLLPDLNRRVVLAVRAEFAFMGLQEAVDGIGSLGERSILPPLHLALRPLLDILRRRRLRGRGLRLPALDGDIVRAIVVCLCLPLDHRPGWRGIRRGNDDRCPRIVRESRVGRAV